MAKDTENAEIIMAKEVRQDMRKSGIPIVHSKIPIRRFEISVIH